MYMEALVDDWTCDFGDGICHRWTVGKEYNVIRYSEEKEIVTYTIPSDVGISEKVAIDLINPDFMKDTFGIEI